jgi:hypothetical protein
MLCNIAEANLVRKDRRFLRRLVLNGNESFRELVNMP